MMKRLLTIAGTAICCVTLAASLSAAGPQKNGSSNGKGDAAKGKETFEQCAICHNVDSPEKKMGPSLQGLFKRKTLTNGKPVNDANVLAQINNGGNGMPVFRDLLTQDEKEALVKYVLTL